jgi:hypothetical protein
MVFTRCKCTLFRVWIVFLSGLVLPHERDPRFAAGGSLLADAYRPHCDQQKGQKQNHRR